ncbi:helix-turn-helix domain-containing protein [Caloramator sp. CAR-1]|uniref:helix-turn-helix domain-containing protein n=1 Tax=Caloramator sp. CAR-1 TaxID=3062777 RepID=UPI0026E1F0BF|nr:helix-turn-helix domain-containing protein [Caloramator sp. CAR-1]MDO6353974.1 helix-turn-helix domain-containing protein [Caloramator sp. CAR-1]
MNIGEKLRNLRLKYNYSTLKLARAAGVAQSYISDIEAGKSNPTIDKLSKILSVYGISLSEFFAEDEPQLSPELKQLLDTAKNLTPEQLSMLNAFIASLGPNRKVVEKEIDGQKIRYVYDTTIKPNGLTEEEEREALEIVKQLHEMQKQNKK